MRPVVLFRQSLEQCGEFDVCRTYLDTVEYRSQVRENALVIPRYSALPFYKELEAELSLKDSVLINTFVQHSFVANMLGWAGAEGVLSDLTPRTWTDWARLPEGSFVVKGKTNSRKHRWNTHMFAPTREDVAKVAARLLDDSLVSEQGLVVRQYVPLRKLGEGLNSLPITNEWRTFWLSSPCGPQLLAKGFYWEASHPELSDLAQLSVDGLDFAVKAAERLSTHVNFFVLDVAETQKGDWIVVEVNDGSMSGPCGCSLTDLYSNLNKAIHLRLT